MLEFWRDKFLELDNGARILDIAAGNGAIATIAAELGIERDKDFFVAATDLADIQIDLGSQGQTEAARKTIDFHGQTPCEKQPFDDDSFDLVTSQFGFEYSDIGKTLVEIRRVLAPGGRFVAISHHADSVLIEASKVEIEIYDYALKEIDLVGTAVRYFKAVGELTGDPARDEKATRRARPLAADLMTRMNAFREKYEEHDCAMFIAGAVSFTVRNAQQTSLQQKLDALGRAQSDFELARARLDDMVGASLDRDQIEAFNVEAKEAGFQSVHSLKLYTEDAGLAGWQIHLR